MSIKDVGFVKEFSNYLGNLQYQLNEQTILPSKLKAVHDELHKKQTGFHEQLNQLMASDVSTWSDLPFKEVWTRAQMVENAFRAALQRQQLSLVKELRTIAHLLRMGEESQALDLFKSKIPDGGGSLADNVFGAIWIMKGKPMLSDFGRYCFYNELNKCVSEDQIPNYTAQPHQKALAIEIAMIGEISKYLSQNNIQQAEREFEELPSHLKKEIYLLLSQKKNSPTDSEIGKSCLFDFNALARESQIECFQQLKGHLEANYPQLGEKGWISILQQDFKEISFINGQKDQRAHLQDEQAEQLFALLRKTQETAFQALQKLYKTNQEEIDKAKQATFEWQKKFTDSSFKTLEAESILKDKSTDLEQTKQLLASLQEDMRLSRTRANAIEKQVENEHVEALGKLMQQVDQKEKAIESLKQELSDERSRSKTRGDQIESEHLESLGKVFQQIEEKENAIQKLKQELFDERMQLATRGDQIHEQYKNEIANLNRQIIELSSQLIKAPVETAKSMSSSFENDFVSLSQSAKPTLMDAFADYVQKYCPGYTVEGIKKQVEKGRDLVEKIQSGEADRIPLYERPPLIVPVTWYMLYYAVGKGQGFNQGMINFRDPGHAIAKFFISCGYPFVYDRDSTHYVGRVLPSFYRYKGGKEAYGRNTYGIDVPQDRKSGLPGNMQTTLFAPLETIDGLDWTCLKPENWGLGDMYQAIGHTVDYLWTRLTRLFSHPNGPDDRKEYPDPAEKSQFLAIYGKATGGKKAPESVQKFGVAAMKKILQAMIGEESLSAEVKKDTQNLLEDWNKKYDYLNTRTGLEATLGESFINGVEPQPHLHQSLTNEQKLILQLKDAQMRTKNAVEPGELIEALANLKKMPALTSQKQNVVNDNAFYYQLNKADGNSALDKTEILGQVNKDLARFGNLTFKVDDKSFKNAEEIYAYLLTVEPFVLLKNANQEREVLRFMALLHQGARADVCIQLMKWFEQPEQGLRVKQYSPKPQEIVSRVIAITGKDPMIEATDTFELIGSDESLPRFYRKESYARMEGTIKINFNQQTAVIKVVIK